MKKKEPRIKEYGEQQTTTNYTTLPEKGVVFISAEEFASRLNITARSVRRRCCQGSIPGAIKAGKLWRIPVKKA